MGQKDITEKLLEDYNDVFADIVNVLLFRGNRIVKEESLKETKVKSQYKAEAGKLHEQERDVAKYWQDGNVLVAICGLENQTAEEKYMPLRVFSYDGASYRRQLLSENDENPIVPDEHKIKHVDEMLKLLQVLTGDDRYNVKFSEAEKKEDIKMCDVMEKAVAEERINSIKILVSSLEEFGISSEAIIEKVMEKFNFSRDEATKYVNK